MDTKGGDLLHSRQAKLRRLIDKGIDPFPVNYSRSHNIAEALDLFNNHNSLTEPDSPNDSLSLAGRIMTMRVMGKASFLHIQDSTGTIQAHLRKDILNEAYDIARDLDLGDFIGVEGSIFVTRTGEITIETQKLTFLAKAMRPLPEKWHGLSDIETRHRQRYLDLITNEESRANFKLRSKIISTIRGFMDSRGFIEVETPVLVPIAAGAMAQPFTTHHNALDQELYLRIATELYLKRLIVGGLDKVYEIGRVFRNEGIDQDHNPEFTLLESYEAYANYKDVMNMVEDMISETLNSVLGITKVRFGENLIDFSPPWKRLDLRDTVKQCSGIDFEQFTDPSDLANQIRGLGIQIEEPSSRGRLIDKLVTATVEPHLIQPTFLLDYPLDMSPLAKQKPDNPDFVERFEAFAGGMEIANSFSELNDPEEQRKRFVEQETLRESMSLNEDMDRLDEDFLVAIEHGMPPTGGLGIGIDRLTMLVTGQTSIREVILFPQLRQR